MEEVIRQPDKAERFVQTIIRHCATNTGFAARLRRADNPDTEYHSWELLVKLGINLDKDWERLPCALIAAAVARAQLSSDGSAGLGRALRSCFSEDEQGSLRLRRLLACERLDELCRVLRPMLRLIESKHTQPLCYGRLLGELMSFAYRAQRVKLGWAQDFYLQKQEGLACEEQEG
ncbi:MAG: type I-E CRISPR-associated protein Cse2/CasB [Desulfovibrionaceae bacterium]|jgi:CRISPR system Cascade subunit CasB|nr:type I-E CRISPR-associated protein Cse2/CasB [Desulfovibrionaceae bacterium]